MKLYYTPGSCSLSVHIALCEANLTYELVQADLQKSKLEDGRDISQVSLFGYIPALELDNGDILTEGPAIVQYIADLVPDKNLAPENGTIERYKMQQWLNLISTELHKGFGGLFNPNISDSARELFIAGLIRRLDVLAPQLELSTFLVGNHYTVADGYLFTVLSWAPHLKFDLSPWPSLISYLKRIGSRPAVLQALKEEGLLD
jgi:glutathione S-transferase